MVYMIYNYLREEQTNTHCQIHVYDVSTMKTSSSSGVNGNYVVQYSTDLLVWKPLWVF